MDEQPRLDCHLHESFIAINADFSEYDNQANSHEYPVLYKGVQTTKKVVSLQTRADVEPDDRKQVAHTSLDENQNALPLSSPSYPLWFIKPSRIAIMDSAMIKKCLTCGTIKSPEWREGPDGNKSLCNACGLWFSRNNRRRRKEESKIAFEVAVNDGSIPAHIRSRIEECSRI